MTNTKPSITLLGPDIDHRKSLEVILAKMTPKVAWIPDSNSYLGGKSRTLQQKLRRAFDQLTYTRQTDFHEATAKHLQEHQTDLVIAYWSTNPLADIAAVRRMRPSAKILLMVLCFPLAMDHKGVRRQHWLMRRAAHNIDGIIYSNAAMQEYFETRVYQGLKTIPRGLILNPCWPASFQAPKPKDISLESPNLIFAGRTDLSHHTVHEADDLRPLMGEILKNQIHLYHVRSPETTDGNPFRHPFEPTTQANLIATMAAHDASLIAYNAQACQSTDRLELTVPDRLLTSVAAGVPIAIPSVGYTGPKQYLKNYPAVIEFSDAADLYRQLADRDRITAMRKAAWEARKNFSAEAQSPVLNGFIQKMLG